MFIKRYHSPFLHLKIVHSCVIFISLFIIGISILTLQATHTYRALTLNRLELSVNLLNGQLQSAQSAVDELLEVATTDCQSSQNKILSLMVKQPSIQSINIIKDGVIICSSYPPLIGEKSSLTSLNSVNLITSSLVVQGKPILIVKGANNNFTVTASLHGFNFLGIIRLLEGDTPFHISTKQGWINSNDVLTTEQNNDSLHIDSKLFPFAISSTIPYFSNAIYILKSNPLSITLLALISLLTALYYFKYQTQRVLKSAMRKGIKKQQFTPFAQALVDKHGQIIGCEILMRWRYRSSLIRPDLFIPTAEASGMIIPMTLALFDEVYQQCLQHQHIFNRTFHLSINLCPTQLSKAHSPELLKQCQRFKVHPSLKHINLVLEITERQIIAHDTETLDVIQQLHNMGIKIAIDDFGTGYSSLENIRDHKIDGLKIDKSFIDGFPNQALSADLIDNMLDLANRLDVSVIAEGVETQEQADYLIEKGVDYLQGYLFHKPEPLEDFLNTQSFKLKLLHEIK